MCVNNKLVLSLSYQIIINTFQKKIKTVYIKVFDCLHYTQHNHHILFVFKYPICVLYTIEMSICVVLVNNSMLCLDAIMQSTTASLVELDIIWILNSKGA